MSSHYLYQRPTLIVPTNTCLFEFEESFNFDERSTWLAENHHIPFVSAILYLLGIVVGPRFMQSKPAFELRQPLILWNMFLAVFSIVATCRSVPDFVLAVNQIGWYNAVCDGVMESFQISTCWVFIFALSKVAELFDTMFLVLRKRKVSFLHWYHHTSVMLFTWHMTAIRAIPGAWFALINMIIHSAMYTYYTLRALGYRLPKSIAIAITCSQIAQMFLGVYLTTYVCISMFYGAPCQMPLTAIYMSVAIYLSYTALFIRFFYVSYIKTNCKSKKLA